MTIATERKLFRVKLVDRKDHKAIGHWCLRQIGPSVVLSTWRGGKESPDPFITQDAQVGVDLLLGLLEANLVELRTRYDQAITGLDKSISEGRELRAGFRSDYHIRLRAQCANTLVVISRKYIAECVAYLDTLPAHGWPPVSRKPFASFDTSTPKKPQHTTPSH